MSAGHSINSLATEFRIDRRTIARVLDLAEVRPCVQGPKGPLYRMRDAVAALAAARHFESPATSGSVAYFAFFDGMRELEGELRRQLSKSKATADEQRFLLDLLARAYWVAFTRARTADVSDTWEPAGLPPLGSVPVERLARWFAEVKQLGGPPGPPGSLLEDQPDEDDEPAPRSKRRARR